METKERKSIQTNILIHVGLLLTATGISWGINSVLIRVNLVDEICANEIHFFLLITIIYLVFALAKIKSPFTQSKVSFTAFDAQYFLEKIDSKKISEISIIAHTGERTVSEVLNFLNQKIEKNELNEKIKIQILLKDPSFETKSRSQGIERIVNKIQKIQNRNNSISIYLKFYSNLPVFRAVFVKGDFEKGIIKKSFVSFYHFKSSISKAFPLNFTHEKKRNQEDAPVVSVAESWFEKFWGKNDLNTHTLVFDFDDTIVKSHEIQIEAWTDLVCESKNKFNLDENNFASSISNIVDDKKLVKEKIKDIFLKHQTANEILENIFIGIDTSIKKKLQNRRFELRKAKLLENENGDSLMYPSAKKILLELYKSYNLIIISATDEKMIQHFLKERAISTNNSIRNMSQIFQYFFGKNESIVGRKELDSLQTKSKLILKLCEITGIPGNRLIYIGDSHEDYIACKEIGVSFIEARLFRKESSIDSLEDREYITHWNELPKHIAKFK